MARRFRRGQTELLPMGDTPTNERQATELAPRE